ncbi:MAG: tRNA threonylcarbamoyladenosine biosynthesis protein TsaE [Eubacteriales bacterium SKADARSKE-1]|nr:tRNA threonylcarbamoyladenosine biosynthesis protein TsaE [Eubacteriales bacterium SKADARSKE-1]
MLKIKSHSPDETEDIAKRFAKKLYGTEIIALYGDLGAGKTCFVRGLCCGLGMDDNVSSPTFAIINEYNGIFNVYHFDMYRITSEEDLYSTGFFDYINDGIIVTEWSENIEEFLPQGTIKVHIGYGKNENERELTFEGINEL